MRDSDLDAMSEEASEDEVLAPRVVDTLSDRPSPRRTRVPGNSPTMTTPLLVGTGLALVVVLSAGVLAISLIVSLWVGG